MVLAASTADWAAARRATAARSAVLAVVVILPSFGFVEATPTTADLQSYVSPFLLPLRLRLLLTASFFTQHRTNAKKT